MKAIEEQELSQAEILQIEMFGARKALENAGIYRVSLVGTSGTPSRIAERD